MNTKDKIWREKNKEYYLAYKKAWTRLSRNNPDYPPEFPDGKQNRTVKRRAENINKPLEMRDLGNGFCKSCESKSKNYYCDYCLKTFPQLLKK